MKRFLSILVLLLAGLSAKAQLYSNTVAANFNFSEITSQNPNIRTLTITPIAPFPGYPWPGSLLPHQSLSNNTFIGFGPSTYSVSQYPQMTNGSLTISNLWTGYPMRVTMSDFYATYIYTNAFPTNCAGQFLDASTNQVLISSALMIQLAPQTLVALWAAGSNSIYPTGVTGTFGGWVGTSTSIYPQ